MIGHKHDGVELPPYHFIINSRIERIKPITFSIHYKFYYYYTMYIELLKRHNRYTDGILFLDKKLKGYRKANTYNEAVKYAKKLAELINPKIKINKKNMIGQINRLLKAVEYEKIVELFANAKDDGSNYYWVGEHKIDKRQFITWNVDGRYRLLLDYTYISYEDFLEMGILEYYDIIDSLEQAKLRRSIEAININILSSDYMDNKERKKAMREIKSNISQINNKHYNTKAEEELLKELKRREVEKIVKKI